MKPQTGFTLIELMMVLIIAGILASVGLPYMRDSLLNSRVRTAASDAHLSLLMARSEAIKRNRNVNINRTGADWANGWSVCVAEPSPNLTGFPQLHSSLAWTTAARPGSYQGTRHG